MKALVYYGTKDLRYEDVPRPMITFPTDVIVKVTATTVCGSDLHLYHGLVPGLNKGDILGHESVGIVDQVGPDV
jgi:threonine dehydrogenase-like Zn-dependent dehydrogenase